MNTSSSGTEPVKLFRDRNLEPQAFTIVNGASETWKGNTVGVSKRSVIGATVVLIQGGRLRVAKGLEFGQMLLEELLNFRMQPAKANDPVEAMREGAHGDLVFAVGLGCWWGDRLQWNDEEIDKMLPFDDDDFVHEERNSVTGY